MQHDSATSSQDPFSTMPEDTRISILAIMSLITGVLCCIPGFGLLGMLLGVVALVAIGASGGRVHGKGLAITGIVLGLVATVIWTAIGVGGLQGFRAYTSTMSQEVGGVFVAAEAGDVAAARAAFNPSVADRISAETLTEFAAAYRDQAGSFVSVSSDFNEVRNNFGALGGQMQGYQGGNNRFPFAFVFDTGPMLVEAQISPNGPHSADRLLSLTDVIITLPDGTEVKVSDYFSAQATPLATTTDAPADPAGGDEDGDDEDGTGDDQASEDEDP